jgi:hypothetical protein
VLAAVEGEEGDYINASYCGGLLPGWDYIVTQVGAGGGGGDSAAGDARHHPRGLLGDGLAGEGECQTPTECAW